MKKIFFFLPILFWTVLSGYAQNKTETGFPAITNFVPNDYDGHHQNWAALQVDNGMLYFGNGNALLEYDGVHWRTYPVPNNSAIRSLAIGDSAKMYAGATGDLGFFQADRYGRMNFHSLKSHLPDDKQDFAPIWQTYYLNGLVYFWAREDVFIWDSEKQNFNVVGSSAGDYRIFSFGNTIYLNEGGKGLGSLVEGAFSLLEDGAIFANDPVYVMLPFPGDPKKMLVVSRKNGIHLYDGKQFSPFPTQADSFLKENPVYCGDVLSDGNILLGTMSGGAVVINTKGELITTYNYANGLRSNTIFFSFQDRAGGLWLGTDNGISQIAYTSPIQWFDTKSNLTSRVFDLFRLDGILYASTSTGVSTLNPGSSQFEPLKGSNSIARRFHLHDGQLLVASDEGLLHIENNSVLPVDLPIEKTLPVSVITSSRQQPEAIFAATDNGLWYFEKTDGKWRTGSQIAEIPDQITRITEQEDGTLWAGTRASGIFRIRFEKDANGNNIFHNATTDKFDESHGLQEGWNYTYHVHGIIYINTRDSLYVFDQPSNQFVADTSLALIRDFYNFPSEINKWKSIFLDQQGFVWLTTKGRLSRGTQKLDGTYEWLTAPFTWVADVAKPFYTEESGEIWMRADDGILRFNLEHATKATPDYPALIRKVSVSGDSILYFGSFDKQIALPEINYATNSVRFEFAASNYKSRNSLRFANYLEHFDSEWTSWSAETYKEYTNLPPGTYTFHVKAIDISGTESLPATYTFEILPPWWRTWWAYAIFILLFGFMLYFFVRLRTNTLQKEKVILEESVSIRTAELKQSFENLKSTQAQLIQSEKMASLGELTAGIAHEIQNPLNFVNNFSEVSAELLDEMAEELAKVVQTQHAASSEQAASPEHLESISEALIILDDVKQNLEKITHHGKRADAIVKGMLAHSRAGKGEKAPTDLNALADEYLRLSYHGFRSKDKSFNADFKTDFDPNLPKVNVVPQDIGRVLLNILNNAFYAASLAHHIESDNANLSASAVQTGHAPSLPRPMVIISTKNLGDKIQISISDNGPGIPDSIKDKIFQPFFTTKPSGQGTGLGLSLSYDIVKAHGGELNVKSQPGETIFELCLMYKRDDK